MDKQPTPSPSSLREKLPAAPKREPHFRWRGNEISRVENFTDAVFAFAVTLLVVALEVPHTFDGLMDVVRGFPAFVICFVLLMTLWSAHYRFHRRYGIDSLFARLTTMAIVVLVLFFVYPLKYLFTMLTVQIFGLDLTNAPTLEGGQGRILYVVYGLGLAGIWGLYAVLYGHALSMRESLKLDTAETLMTRASLGEYLIYVGVSLLSVALALLTTNTWIPGVIYFVLGPLQAFNGWWFGRKLNAPAVAGA